MPGTLISRRQVGLAFARVRPALSNAAICSRSCRQHGRSWPRVSPAQQVQRPAEGADRRGQQLLNASVKGKPPHRAGQHPKRLEHPRMWFDSRVAMPTSDFTGTGRYPPVRMICASPSASFWSVLLICSFSAALACRASRQTTSSPRPHSSCTSHGVIGPVCSPTCPFPPARPLTARSVCAGVVAHRPRHNQQPVPSTTQTAVSFCNTSKPTHRVVEPSPMCEPPDDNAPIAAS